MVLFFLTSQKNAVGPKGQAFEASHEEAQVSSGHPKGWVTVMRTWQSPYEIIGDGCDAGGQRYQTLHRFILREQLLAFAGVPGSGQEVVVGGIVTTCERGACTHRVTSTVDIDGRPIFFGMRAHRRSILTGFFLV